MNTDCRYEIVKKAFLFSCFTGLRYSDMKSLRWSEIHQAADGKTLYIEKQQVKTKGTVTIPLSDEAMRWMPERVDGIDTVFHELTITSTTVELLLKEWTDAAGIDKHITYHCSRHTAATLLLTLGANLYVVSKLLGHKSIKMTEVYAKIVDKKKIETMNLVNNMFETA
jgi:integrase